MKLPLKYIMAGLVLLVIGLVGCTAIDSSASGDSSNNAAQTEDVAKVKDVWKEYDDSLKTGDLERWLALWIADGIQMPPDEPRHIGIEQIRIANQHGFELFDFNVFAINPEEVRVLGDRAYSHGSYHFSMTPKEGGETLNQSGKFLTILEKQADGSWKIAIDIFNYSPQE